MTHHPNTPASRTGSAAPGAAIAAREQESSFAHKVKVWSAEIERLIGIADQHAPGQGALDTALNMLDYMKRQAVALASRQEAPAIAARGQEVDEATALKGGRWVSADDIEHMTGELLSLATGDPYTPTKMVDAFHTLRAALASRQEAPTASAQPACTCCGCGGCKSCLSGRNRCPKHSAARSPATVAQPVGWQERQQTIDGWTSWYESQSTCTTGKTEAFALTSGGIPYEFRPLFAQPCPSQGCAALQAIAEFPVTDEASNMDASNMRQIARAALSGPERPK